MWTNINHADTFYQVKVVDGKINGGVDTRITSHTFYEVAKL